MSRKRKRTVAPTTSRTGSQGQEWVLTLDISSTATGFAYACDDEKIKYGKYISRDGLSLGHSLLEFSKWLTKTVNGLPYPPTVVLIEAPYYSGNAQTFSILSKFVGTAEREIFRILGVVATPVPSSAVKRVLDVPAGRTYRDRKYNMVKKINATLGITLNFHATDKHVSDDDIADAIAILMYYFIMQRRNAK